MEMVGNIYPIFASHFEPFSVEAHKRGDGLEFLLPISGKAMAYASLGKVSDEAIAVMDKVTGELGPVGDPVQGFVWSRRVLDRTRPLGLSDASLLASFEQFLFRALINRLGRVADADLPLCLSGGCALNIKWNSGLRRAGLFGGVWVPPFSNDAGSAIGAACAEMIDTTGSPVLEWDVFSGPELVHNDAAPQRWHAMPCQIEQVGRVLHETGQPVVVLSGRAELGPRALGHRSIIAPAVDDGMRERLNKMKGREWYRPVAPICLEHRAPEVFSPGTPDPYMLFDHAVRPQWSDRIPAVMHVDGSARLQTVGTENSVMHRLLSAYERLSGIPVLCNTSANLSGSGFFPDPASAMAWDQASYVWADGRLFWDSGAVSCPL
jgi:carbamoyltransferase